jgi:hypothetical protein
MSDQDQTAAEHPLQPMIDEMVDVQSVDQFAAMITHWHAGMLARLRNLREIPFGTLITLIENDGSETKVKLKGDGMKGFQGALNAAIAEIESLPFVVSTTPVPDMAEVIGNELGQD